MLRLWTLCLTLLAGCTIEAGPEEGQVCEAGKVESCPCADGSPGTQACNADGAGWGACMCDTPTVFDPVVACSMPQTELEHIAEFRCKAPKPRAFFMCSKEIVEAGVCTKNANTLNFCCP